MQRYVQSRKLQRIREVLHKRTSENRGQSRKGFAKVGSGRLTHRVDGVLRTPSVFSVT